MTTYDDFERELTERLSTISEEIEVAKEQGRQALKDPTDKVGRVLAAQTIKLKTSERSRVAAMLAGVQQQRSELAMTQFTSQYLNLMKKSSKMGSVTEKQVESVVNAYQSKLEGTVSVGTMLMDSADDALESSMDVSDAAFPNRSDDDSGYAALFGEAPAPAPVQAPAPAPASVSAESFPAAPTGTPGSKNHKRTPSATALDFMLN